MITEPLKVKLADLSLDLGVQKCLAIEQSNKDVQVRQGEQGPGTPINKLDTVNTGEEQASSKPPPPPRVPGGKTLRSLNLVTAVRDHITHKSVPS